MDNLDSNSTQNDLYIFISYARPQQQVAEQIEHFLTTSGIKVFRDTNEIRNGANWDMTIEKALQEADRMVLLLSSDSMPYRKEVHREWFFFDQQRKPIYPIYVEDCQLHSRMYVYNYIDARENLKVALQHLLVELQREFMLPDLITPTDQVSVISNADIETRTLTESMQAILNAVKDPTQDVVLTVDQAIALKDYKPLNLTEYYLGRIAEWSLPRYLLDKRFVNLTLLIDKGESEQERWQKAENLHLNELTNVLSVVSDPAMVLLGAPGSGKSTLLRRLQLDQSIEQLINHTEQVSFFVQLNGYRGQYDPREWLNMRWTNCYPDLESLDSYLRDGKVILFLDALNEMQHNNTAEYHKYVGLWRDLTQELTQAGNRIIFTCRSLDYSASLSSPTLRVPQIEVQPMDTEQVHKFLNVYTPTHANLIWNELNGSAQLSLFQTPYFLKLLCEQVEATNKVPKGRAGLFTGFVRQALYRELHRELFQPDTLLTDKDHQKLSLKRWRSPFDLPERGVLISRLNLLAFSMQQDGLETEGAQVRIDYDDACDLINHERDEDILKAGVALNVLDEDITQYEITFFHQLLQEFFAARELSRNPNPELVHVEWEVDKVSPSLNATLADLAYGDPLPSLPQTGWEETTLTATPMTQNPNKFIRDLIEHNLPLAARCANSSEIAINDDLKYDIQQRLINRTQDMNADLRVRISAGLALGELGDPRFKKSTGQYGDYLVPPMKEIPAGEYLIGDDGSKYVNEKPAHTITLDKFLMGEFPVTNAEFAYFIQSGAYTNEQWWVTDEAKARLKGERSTTEQRLGWEDTRHQLQSMSDDEIKDMGTIQQEQRELFLNVRNWDDAAFYDWLDRNYPLSKIYYQPEFWDDSRFNNPAQPVVGLTWHEANAYCAWLSAQTGHVFHLPSEVQFEAAARGKTNYQYPYGNIFDSLRSNTFDSHIRRTTPVGVFDNATSQGIYDLSGNVYTWTISIYNQEKFPYPYNPNDGREDIEQSAYRMLRGGSWVNTARFARISTRFDYPLNRYDNIGMRLCRKVT